MITTTQSHLLAVASLRPPGYVAAVLAAASEVHADYLLLTPAAFADLRHRFPVVGRAYSEGEAAADAALWPTFLSPPSVPVTTAPAEPSIKPLPRNAWPAWTAAVLPFARAGDAGIGDTLTRCLHFFGADAMARLYALTFGGDLTDEGRCGACNRRAGALNQRFPY